MRCPEEKLSGKRLRKQLLPFLMPGHRTRGSGPTWAGKADPCFYLNGGNDHAGITTRWCWSPGSSATPPTPHTPTAVPPLSANRSHLETGSSAFLRHRRPPRRWAGVEPAVWLVDRGKAKPSSLPLRHRPHLRRGGETSAFYEVTRAAEGALGGAPPFLHCRRLHRRRKETPTAYQLNRRSGVNRTP